MSIVKLDREIRTQYYSSDYSKSDVKFRQRELILRFFRRYFVENFKMSVLTLPGEHWLFEQMMLKCFPYCSFTGLERSSPIYHRSRLHIPRNALAYVFDRDEVQDRVFNFGRSNIIYSRLSNGLYFDGYKASKRPGTPITSQNRRSNRLVLMDVHDFLSLLTEDHHASMVEKRRFVERFYRKHAVWLDFTGPLTERNLETISKVGLCLYPSIRLKPIVFTVLNGRDRFTSKQQRIDAIKQKLPQMTIKHSWTYRGAGNVSMLTVCGEMA